MVGMTTPTQETGQPLDFTRPLELVCDGTEVVAVGPDGDGDYLIIRKNAEHFSRAQHPDGFVDLTFYVDERGRWIEDSDPTGPQIVRNRAEANTPVQGDGLVERARAMLAAGMRDVDRKSLGNGYLERDAKLLEEGGLGHVDAWIALDVIAAALAHQPTTDAEAVVRIGPQYSLFWASPDTITNIVSRTGITVGSLLYAHPPADKARIAELEAEVARLTEALADANQSVIAFGAVHAAHYAHDRGLPDGVLDPVHYDILQAAGARMDSFDRYKELDDD